MNVFIMHPYTDGINWYSWFTNLFLEAKLEEDCLCMFCWFKEISKKPTTRIRSEIGKIILLNGRQLD